MTMIYLGERVNWRRQGIGSTPYSGATELKEQLRVATARFGPWRAELST